METDEQEQDTRAKRRKDQNRRAQRNYRNNVKKRIKGLETINEALLLGSMPYGHQGVDETAFQQQSHDAHGSAHDSAMLETPPSQQSQHQKQWNVTANPPSSSSSTFHAPSSQPLLHQDQASISPAPDWDFFDLPDFEQTEEARPSSRLSDRSNAPSATPERLRNNIQGLHLTFPGPFEENQDKDLLVTGLVPSAAGAQLTPLLHATMQGHHKLVRLLLLHGADTNVPDTSGRTALHHAVKAGDLVVVQALLRAGAQIDALDPDGYTSLQIASMGGNYSVAAELLDNGAMVNGRNPRDSTLGGALPRSSIPDAHG